MGGPLVGGEGEKMTSAHSCSLILPLIFLYLNLPHTPFLILTLPYPRWEAPNSYASRILDQLIDYVVQSHRPQERIPLSLGQSTGEDGLAKFDLCPLSKATVSIEVEQEFDADNGTATMDLSIQPEQFLGFQLERRCFVDIRCIHCESLEGLEGFVVKVYDVTDQVRGDKIPTRVGLPPELQAKRQKVQDEELALQASSLVVKVQSFLLKLTL